MAPPKFTPGYWYAEADFGWGVWARRIDGGDDYGVADCEPILGENPTEVQAEANARLIAAAPDMYEALADCIVSLCAANLEHLPSLAKARAALAKAEGRDAP